jgi:ribokinase
MFDFISIGDTVTDDFIKLKDVRIDKEADKGDLGYDEICFRFGDKVEFEESVVVPAVGNAANAAVSATRLGLNTAFITDIGTDDRGKTKMKTLKEQGVDCKYVKEHEGMESNYHYVLRFGAERTILIKHHEYPYALPSDLESPKWFYFSSVGEHGLPYHDEIAEYLKNNPESKFAFQPGTFQISLGYERLKEMYEESDIFFCNKEEAQKILGTSENDIEALLKEMRKLGPKLSVITDGRGGAYTFDGEEIWHMPMYPDPAPPVDRTGAGDAFSSTFTAALAAGEDIPTALSWGPINSMSVVQYIGAQEGLLSREQLLEHLKNAPADYKPEKIL